MDKNARVAPIGRDLITVTDSLVESGDITGLEALDKAISKLITVADIVDEEVSIVEISEYIQEAQEILKAGKTSADAKASSIRKLLDHRS